RIAFAAKAYSSQTGSYVFLDPVYRSGVKDGSRLRANADSPAVSRDTRFIPQSARINDRVQNVPAWVAAAPPSVLRTRLVFPSGRTVGRRPPRRVRSVPGKADYVLPTSVAAWRSSSSCVVRARWAVSK